MMSLQLVTACEALPAEQPVTDERALARVPPQVRLQVRRLAVHAPTSRYVADVLSLALARVVALRVEAVGAATATTLARH